MDRFIAIPASIHRPKSAWAAALAAASGRRADGEFWEDMRQTAFRMYAFTMERQHGAPVASAMQTVDAMRREFVPA